MADFYGTIGNDSLVGGAGNDDVVGRAGNDVLRGGAGNDDIVGGAGNDTLDGGAGNDDMIGGQGADVFLYGSGADEIDRFQSEDRITLDASLGVTSFSALLSLASTVDGGDSTLFSFGGGNSLLLEDVRLPQLTASQFGFNGSSEPTPPTTGSDGGTDGNDVIRGTSAGDDINAGAGNDVVDGRGGRDDIYGSSGDDTLNGGGGRDDIEGGIGNDVISGGGGADELYGGGGNDTLDGGRGRDELRGGLGSDTFIFGQGRDEIEDFQEEDIIQISSDLGVTSFAQVMDLARSVDGGDDVLIDFGGGNKLRLEDTALQSLDAGDFTFG